MSEETNILWCDSTWNPWRGCTKVSAGCAHCYAETLVTRKMGGEWGKGALRARSKTTLNDPLKWNKKPCICNYCGEAFDIAQTHRCTATRHGAHDFHRRRVFSLSLGDWLDDEVQIEWLADMLDVIRRCPNLDFLLLTKRPENWRDLIEYASLHPNITDITQQWLFAWLSGTPPANIWIGVSVENQKALSRIVSMPPAVVKFVSIEPLLEDLGSIEHTLHDNGISWVIVGGESGSPRRDCGVEAIESVAQQCQAAGVPVFVKQDCAFYPGEQGRIPNDVWSLRQFPQPHEETK